MTSHRFLPVEKCRIDLNSDGYYTIPPDNCIISH